MGFLVSRSAGERQGRSTLPRADRQERLEGSQGRGSPRSGLYGPDRRAGLGRCLAWITVRNFSRYLRRLHGPAIRLLATGVQEAVNVTLKCLLSTPKETLATRS